jgi:hypothetical protein
MQRLADAAAEALPAEHGLDAVPLAGFGDCRQAHHFPLLLRQHVAGEVIPRAKPEGRLSCNRWMISTMAPTSLSLRRL